MTQGGGRGDRADRGRRGGYGPRGGGSFKAPDEDRTFLLPPTHVSNVVIYFSRVAFWTNEHEDS